MSCSKGAEVSSAWQKRGRYGIGRLDSMYHRPPTYNRDVTRGSDGGRAIKRRRDNVCVSASAGQGNTGYNGCGTCLKSRAKNWEKKSDIYILRSDGFSCTRETVTSDGSLQFEHPSSQQHLLVWKARPKSVMVLKKVG
eukprot:jgi/Picre1/30786/NNA_006146.t1